MHRFALDVPVDVNELRERLLKMSDEDLRRFGRAAPFELLQVQSSRPTVR
jgi:hypothetical protein